MNWFLIICYASCTLGMPDVQIKFDTKENCIEAKNDLVEQGAKFAFCRPMEKSK